MRHPSRTPLLSVLFVCLGNHCRSPSAEAIAKSVAKAKGLSDVLFDSAGTSDEHRGDEPHPLAQVEGRRRGYAVEHVGRKIHPDDFSTFDLIVAMDQRNVDDLTRLGGAVDQRIGWCREVEPHQLQLVRRWDPYAMPGDEQLADPWGRSGAAYAAMFDVLERSIPPLVDHLAWLLADVS